MITKSNIYELEHNFIHNELDCLYEYIDNKELVNGTICAIDGINRFATHLANYMITSEEEVNDIKENE